MFVATRELREKKNGAPMNSCFPDTIILDRILCFKY